MVLHDPLGNVQAGLVTTLVATQVRKALLPVLVLTLPVLGSVTVARTTRHERVAAPAAPALPAWSLLDLRGTPIPRSGDPVAVIYTRSDCVYCGQLTQAFDSISDRLHLSAVMITNESRHAADVYQRRLGARRALALDTGSRWGRAAALRGVPAVITRDRRGVVRISYGDRPSALLRQTLESVR